MNKLHTKAATPESKIGTPEQFNWLLGLVKALLILNLLDAILTLFWVYSGLGQEMNPLLRDLIENSPIGFVIVKLSLVALGSLLLWRHRERKLAVIAIVLAFLLYYGLLLWHIGLLSRILIVVTAT